MRKQFTLKSRGLFDPKSDRPFKISRTGIELFVECPRCFYLNHRFGVRRPSGPPFTINSLVDRLLKKEFDFHRAAGSAHPLMREYGVEAVPFQHPKLDEWRENFKGLQYLHPPTNLMITGAIDDLWCNSNNEIIVVDYKATAKSGDVNIDAEWQQAYKRQMEVYQWLVRKQNLRVSNTGYFVYCNGQDAEAFDGRVEFAVRLLPYVGSDDWVEGVIGNIKAVLAADTCPSTPETCEFCGYTSARVDFESVSGHYLKESGVTEEKRDDLTDGRGYLTERGELVRRKSEVTIANKLQSRGVDYSYEKPFSTTAGHTMYPDFTIRDRRGGVPFYWEHLMALDDPHYQELYDQRHSQYVAGGIVPWQEGGGPNGTLIETFDTQEGGLDAAIIDNLIENVLKIKCAKLG